MLNALLGPLIGLEARRRRALKHCRAAVMRDYLATPLPTPRTRCAEADIVALDFETTGLDPRRDQILSIGRVDIEGLGIRLASANHQLVRGTQAIPAHSAAIHHITDDRSAGGEPLDKALPRLLQALAGRFILVHHAAVERGFLDTACRQLYQTPFVGRFVDTERVARRSMERRHQPIGATDLRLFNLRQRHQLPRYRAHDALSDALATAELFLALAADKAPDGGAVMADFL